MKTGISVPRDPRFAAGAFTGNYYVVNTETGLAVQSEYSPDRARAACSTLNDHNVAYGHSARFEIIEQV